MDEIFQRDLGIAKEAFTVEMVGDPKDIYTLEATDGAGKVVYHAAFWRRRGDMLTNATRPG